MDYNYNNFYGESSQPLDTPTYSLWNGSLFFNTNDLRPQNLFASSQVEQDGSQLSVSPAVKRKREVMQDVFNRRIISIVSLYNNPDFFYDPENEPETPLHGPSMEAGRIAAQPPTPPCDDWSEPFWRRTEKSNNNEPKGIGNIGRAGKVSKQRTDCVARATTSGDVEREGGALVASDGGDSAVEPIAPPNTDQPAPPSPSSTTADVRSPKKKAKQNLCPQKAETKEHLITNALLHILELVRNDRETEIVFDVKLTSKERCVLHRCVANDSCAAERPGRSWVRVTIETQPRALMDLRQFKNYVLYAESQLIKPHRSLRLYQDAPANVYLFTPKKFKVDPDDRKEDPPNADENAGEDNPFLKSIQRNLMRDELRDTPSRLTKHFLKFVRDDAYTEFRFLGPFTNEQSTCLDWFLNEVEEIINNEGSCGILLCALAESSAIYELRENCNGSMVIHKLKNKDEDTT